MHKKSRKSKINKNELKHTQTIIGTHGNDARCDPGPLWVGSVEPSTWSNLPRIRGERPRGAEGGGGIPPPKFGGFVEFSHTSRGPIHYSSGSFVVPMGTTKLPEG